MKIGIIGDLHIAPIPEKRIDDYFETGKNKLEQIAQNCDAVIHLGDVFTHSKVEEKYVYDLITHLRYCSNKYGTHFYSIVGNHDVLSEDEVKDIFFDFIHQLYSKDEPKAVIIEEYMEEIDDEIEIIDINDNINYMQKILEKKNDVKQKKDDTFFNADSIIGNRDSIDNKDADKLSKILGKPEVVEYGCKVKLYKKKAGKDVIYIIPKKDSNETWFMIQKSLLNKKIGDSVFCAGDTYEIVDITW